MFLKCESIKKALFTSAFSEYCTSSSNVAYMSVEEEYKFKLTVMKCRPTAVPLPRDPANFPLWSAPGNTTSRLSPPRLCFDGRVSGQTRPSYALCGALQQALLSIVFTICICLEYNRYMSKRRLDTPLQVTVTITDLHFRHIAHCATLYTPGHCNAMCAGAVLCRYLLRDTCECFLLCM